MSDYLRGSEWRRWDLHLHTASSYDYKYHESDADEKLCKTLEENGIAAVAITDHFIIDKNRIEHLKTICENITFFPGVELRTDKGGKNIHIILIFNENTNLDLLSNDFDTIMLRDKAMVGRNTATNMTADEIREQYQDDLHWNFQDIVEFAHKYNAIISIHAGRKANGIDREVTQALEYRNAVKDEIAEKIDVFEVSSLKDIKEYEEHVIPDIKSNKPIIICSDNHHPNQYSPNEKLWIKSNCTFEGLRQCLVQPDDRVFIGEMPDTLVRINDNPLSTLKTVEIHQIDNSERLHPKWFDVSLPLNPGLIAIIGNKGSGKSALSDILGLLCNSKNIDFASFLNPKRFRKKPLNYSRDYNAKAIWYDDNTLNVNLNDKYKENLLSYAQYLPQNYIEDICNTLDDKFQREIDAVIFSYIDDSEKGRATNLSMLLDNKSEPYDVRLESLKQEMSKINRQIIGLEDLKTSTYRKKIEGNIESYNKNLIRVLANKPKRVSRVHDENTDKEYRNEIQKISNSIFETTEKIEKKRNEIRNLTEILNDCRVIIAEMKELEAHGFKVQRKIDSLKEKYSMTSDFPKIKVYTSREIFEGYIEKIEEEKMSLTQELNDPQKGLNIQLELLKSQKKKIIEKTSESERKYQKFITDYQNWKQQCLKIIGDKTSIDTLRYFHARIKYLDDKLDDDYKKALENRYEILKRIFSIKQKIKKIYQDIYNPIQSGFNDILGELDEKITFRAAMQIDNNDEFIQSVLTHINLRRGGVFQGRDSSNEKMKSLLADTDFEDYDSLKNMIDEITNVITEDFDHASLKVSNRQLFYDDLFDLGFLNINFRLNVGNKCLDELSPGERGIALLLFYLALSKDNSPIIIDQPEDNLDNQSVFSKLVPSIKNARKNRQVIIVTHNPNIAIACDADQIIYSQMDKTNQSFLYVSGAIEDGEMKQHVTDVLEGTMPAFELRRKKYNYNGHW